MNENLPLVIGAGVALVTLVFGGLFVAARRRKAAAEELVGQGFLLAEDVARYVAAAQARNPLDASITLRPLILPKS